MLIHCRYNKLVTASLNLILTTMKNKKAIYFSLFVLFVITIIFYGVVIPLIIGPSATFINIVMAVITGVIYFYLIIFLVFIILIYKLCKNYICPELF